MYFEDMVKDILTTTCLHIRKTSLNCEFKNRSIFISELQIHTSLTKGR